jgi:DNA-binding PadR family transcriptional regulator
MDVLDVLAAATLDDPAYGLQICHETGLGSGSVYPILERLAELGWLDIWDEAGQPSGRPRRKFYVLNGVGRRESAQAIAAWNARRLRWLPASGTS